MAIKTSNELKAYFETGDTPTQEQFGDLIDSTYRGYKVLIGNITQSGIADATLNILENTLGGIPTITTDLFQGNFDIILTDAFSTADKVYITVKPSEFKDVFVSAYHNNKDSVRITCRDIATGIGASNKLYEHSFEVRVYN